MNALKNFWVLIFPEAENHSQNFIDMLNKAEKNQDAMNSKKFQNIETINGFTIVLVNSRLYVRYQILTREYRWVQILDRYGRNRIFVAHNLIEARSYINRIDQRFR